MTKPAPIIRRSGVSEKPVIRSMCRRRRRSSEYFECPAERASCWTRISTGLRAYRYPSAGMNVRTSRRFAIALAISRE